MNDLGGGATRSSDSGVVHNARRSHLAGALAVEQVAGVDSVQKEGIAGIALSVGPNGLIAKAGVARGAGRQLGIHPSGQNGKYRETAGGKCKALDLFPI